jgi:hypothetical protein
MQGINISVWSNGSVSVGAEGPKVRSDGTAGSLKGYVHIGPADFPSWLQELVAQQKKLIKLH